MLFFALVFAIIVDAVDVIANDLYVRGKSANLLM